MKVLAIKILSRLAPALFTVFLLAPDSSADLWSSVMGDYPKGVREAIAAGEDVDKKNDAGWTPLYWALSTGKSSGTVRALVENGADVNFNVKHEAPVWMFALRPKECLSFGNSVLWLEDICSDSRIRIFERAPRTALLSLLVDHGADPNARDQDKTPVLTACIRRGDRDAAQVLFDRGAKFPRGPAEPLTKAIFKGDLAAVKAAVGNGASVKKGEPSPAFLAAALGHAEILGFLMEKGSDPNGDPEVTALQAAAAGGHAEAVAVLLEKGEDPNKANRRESPTYQAGLNGHRKAFELLLAKGGVFDLDKDLSGRIPAWGLDERGVVVTAWDWVAANRAYAKILPVLKSRGVTIDANRPLAWTNYKKAIDLAVGDDQDADAAAFLVETGADVRGKVSDLILAAFKSGDTRFLDIASAAGELENYEWARANGMLSWSDDLTVEKRRAVFTALVKAGYPVNFLPAKYSEEVFGPAILEAEKAGDLDMAARRKSDALLHYLDGLKWTSLWSEQDRRLRRKAIAAASFRPPLPEEVKRRTVRAQTFVKEAAGAGDFLNAAVELQAASRLAPWEPGIYYNLALVFEKAGQFPGAIQSMSMYLTADPQAKDAEEIKTKIYELEAKRDMGAR